MCFKQPHVQIQVHIHVICIHAIYVCCAICRAVMVFIHGGALTIGSSADMAPEALAIAAVVIVVTINYRLNVFGFLALDEENVPGNVGMLDQVGLHYMYVFVSIHVLCFTVHAQVYISLQKISSCFYSVEPTWI